MNPARLFQHLRTPLIRAVGPVTRAHIEPAVHEDRIDHVWITIEPIGGFPVLLAVNTLSMKNRLAGYDERVRVGRVRESWVHLPADQIEECPSFSYADIEEGRNVFYETLDRPAMEDLLLGMAESCRKLEVWGTPYRNKICGLHQIHSRAPSCAVAEGIENRDGALRFYLDENQETLLLLFKFCGQA